MNIETFLEEIENLSPKRRREAFIKICEALERHFRETRENIDDFDDEHILETLTPELCDYILNMNGWDAFGTEGLDV